MDPPVSTSRVRFGEFEADLRTGELRQGGRVVRVAVQPFQLLALLLERPGELVTREELRQTLWPADTFVDFDVGLNSAIRKLRDALGDSAEHPTYVETLPRRGYRFIASIADAAPAAAAVAEAAAQVTQPQAAQAAASHPKWVRLIWVAGLAAAFVVALVAPNFGGLWRRLAGRPSPGEIRAIAVLPLVNMTGDPGQDYFADGMTDALITDLAQIRALRVISRTSTMHYKGSQKPLPEIAQELDVDGVIEGTVARSGNHVRVTAQLIHARSDRHLWAKNYERDLMDVVSLQNELAGEIATEVAANLTPQERARLTSTRQVNADSYDAYLRGRFFWNKRNKEALNKSIEYFNQSIQIDSGYAPAYAGLADAYSVLASGLPAGISPKEAGPKAISAAMRAVELDPNSAEAHAALGFARDCFGEDAAGTEEEYKRAVALNPNYATAHHWYALYLNRHGRTQESFEQIEQALKFDPVNPNISGLLAMLFINTKQYDKAVEQLRRALELEPQQFNTRVRLGIAYGYVRRYQDAVSEFKKAEEISPGSLASLGSLAYVYAISGQLAEAEKILPEVTARAEKTGHPAVVAKVYSALGRRDEAIQWIRKAWEQKDRMLSFDDDAFDPLRSDPQFRALKRLADASQGRETAQ
jgi:TolB-like protein/DNA-binding winged helix-turn-helix (wHTH) protein/Flp pilus assembly protein TadD